MFSYRLIFTSILISISLIACQKESDKESGNLPKSPVPQPIVVTTHPKQTSLTSPLFLTGQIEAKQSAALGFQVAGRIALRFVKQGDKVQSGQLLMQIDDRDYQLKVAAVKAKIRSTESDLETAKRDLARVKDLRQRKLVSQQQVDNAQNAVTKLTAALAALQPELKLAENQLQYTQLKAPENGIITAIQTEAGQVVGAGTPVLQIAYDTGRLARFALPEAFLLQQSTLPQKQTVQLNGQTLIAALYDQAPSADPISRTWQVRYQLPPQIHAALGQTVTTTFQPSHPKTAWQLPNTAILMESQHAFVYRVSDQTLQKVPVQIQKLDQRHAWVTGTLSANDSIVQMGVHTLHDGEKVRAAHHE